MLRVNQLDARLGRLVLENEQRRPNEAAVNSSQSKKNEKILQQGSIDLQIEEVVHFVELQSTPKKKPKRSMKQRRTASLARRLDSEITSILRRVAFKEKRIEVMSPLRVTSTCCFLVSYGFAKKQPFDLRLDHFLLPRLGCKPLARL